MRFHTARAATRRQRARALGAILALAVLAAGLPPAGASAAIHPASAARRSVDIVAVKDEVAQGTVTCPEGMRAISGGAAFHRPGVAPVAGFMAKLISSAPTRNGRGWHAAGSSFETDPLRLRVRVACLPDRLVGSYTVVTRDQRVSIGTQTTLSASCGTGKRLVAAGAYWNPRAGSPQPNGADNLLRSMPTAGGYGWQATGFSYGADLFRVILLCRPKKAVGAVSVRTREIGGSAYDRDGTVDCPSGRRALGGGVDWRKDGAAYSGSLTSSTVTADGAGWYAAASGGTSGVVLRVRVLCVPE